MSAPKPQHRSIGDWLTDWSLTQQAAADVVIVDSGTYMITLDTAHTIHSLTMDAPGVTLVLDAGLLAGGDVVLTAGTIEFAGGSLKADHFTMNGGWVHGHEVEITASEGIAINQGSVTADLIELTSASSIACAGTLEAAVVTATVVQPAIAPTNAVVPITSVSTTGIAAGNANLVSGGPSLYGGTVRTGQPDLLLDGANPSGGIRSAPLQSASAEVEARLHVRHEAAPVADLLPPVSPADPAVGLSAAWPAGTLSRWLDGHPGMLPGVLAMIDRSST